MRSTRGFPIERPGGKTTWNRVDSPGPSKWAATRAKPLTESKMSWTASRDGSTENCVSKSVEVVDVTTSDPRAPDEIAGVGAVTGVEGRGTEAALTQPLPTMRGV